MAEKSKCRFSLFITPNVRDNLLVILGCASSNSYVRSLLILENETQ